MKESNKELLKVAKGKAKEIELMSISGDEEKRLIRFFQLQKFAAEKFKNKPNMRLRSLRRLLVRKFRKQGVSMKEALQVVPKSYVPIPLNLKN